MGRIRQFRNPKLSLWQSSVDAVLARRQGVPGAGAGRPDTDDPIMDAATELAARIDSGQPVPHPGAALAAASGIGEPILYCARLAMALAEAKVTGRARDAERYAEELDAESGQCDADWAEVAEQYARNLILRLREAPYRRHQAIGDFVIEGTLPASARVALVSDWGTGQEAARRVIAQIARKRPTVVIHLGGIYYSGTAFEVENYFLAPLREQLDPAKTPCFSLSGNHEMYSGGYAYYDELLPALGQPASYFCLRNDGWQFIAIDTGLHDRIPGGYTTYLETSEVEWLADKIHNAGGRQTVLLSHHPLFSAYERIGDTFYNKLLYEQVSSLLDGIALWFWGYEHRLLVYEEFGLLQPGLKRGRCIGCGAFPVALDEEPAAPLFPEVRINESARLGRGDAFYNHAYAVMELDEAAAKIAYYQDTDEDTPIFEETVASTAVAGRGSSVV